MHDFIPFSELARKNKRETTRWTRCPACDVCVLGGVAQSVLSILVTAMFVSSCGADWQRDSHVLLTNFHNMYNPCVVETSGEYRYKMWLFGWAVGYNQNTPGCDAIFHARSKDLRTWEVYRGDNEWDRTMDPSKWIAVVHASDRWYESWHAGDPSVVMKDGQFFMAYSATSKPFKPTEGYPFNMVQCIMSAVSEDGVHWERASQPLLTAAPRKTRRYAVQFQCDCR